MKLKSTLFMLVLVSLFHLTTNAQWAQIGYMINGADTVSGGNFASFGNAVFCTTSKGLFKSTDNGDTWANVTYNSGITQNEAINCVFVASNGDVYAGATKKLFKSTDNCATWSAISSLPDSLSINDIAESNGNILFSYTKSATYGIYYSGNAGSSWTLATGLTSIAKYFLRDGNILYVGGTANGVYKSTDDGKTWAIAGTGFPASAGIWDVKKSNNKLFVNSISGAGIFSSSDNGATWTKLDTAVFKGFCQVFSIEEAGNTLLATMDGACNQGVPIKASTDGGATWSSFMSGLNTGFYPSVGRNANGSTFFTKTGKKVYRYSGITGIAKNNGVQNKIIAHPNPSNGLVKLTLPIDSKEFQIFNVLGKLIESRQTEGQTDFQIHLNENGIYFLKTTLAGQVYTQKLIVNR